MMRISAKMEHKIDVCKNKIKELNCKSFGMVLHGRLLQRLLYTRSPLSQVRRSKIVCVIAGRVVEDCFSNWKSVTSSVPHGSCWDPCCLLSTWI